jgi:hypothetical protein
MNIVAVNYPKILQATENLQKVNSNSVSTIPNMSFANLFMNFHHNKKQIINKKCKLKILNDKKSISNFHTIGKSLIVLLHFQKTQIRETLLTRICLQ